MKDGKMPSPSDMNGGGNPLSMMMNNPEMIEQSLNMMKTNPAMMEMMKKQLPEGASTESMIKALDWISWLAGYYAMLRRFMAHRMV